MKPLVFVFKYKSRFVKNYIPFLALLFLSLISYSQHLEKEISQQFGIRFSYKEDKEDLVRLRDFLDTKDAEYTKLRAEEQSNQRPIFLTDSSSYVEYKNQLISFLENHKKQKDPFEKDSVDAKIQSICYTGSAIDTIDINGVKKPVFYVQRALDNFNDWLSYMHWKYMIQVSLDNINIDREAAAKAIQRIYNVEKGNQNYKTTISLYYAIIIFFLIVISFLFLFKKSSAEIGNDFLNGNGLQFIALFAIIISTILFGILGILEGKELAAILSGIAGFILGKGLNVTLNKKN